VRRGLLADANRPTALFCFSDLVTVDVYKVAQSLGLRIPQDLSVVGFDDIELASVLGPPLTTISYSIYDVGNFVGGKMVEYIRHKKQINGLEKVFKPRLVERESVAAIPR
jgi:LacI family transcriptional regulator